MIGRGQEGAEKGMRVVDGLMKIGEVARRAGLSVETLRFYERSGLLPAPPRTSGGYRLYGREALQTLDFIRRAQTLGFTLDEIRRLIAERQSGRRPCAEVREIVRGRLAELDRRLVEMRHYRDELATALDDWDRAGEADGQVCGLIEGIEISQPPIEATLKRRKR
jgi:DNA-binding transcriptional MerR regulator